MKNLASALVKAKMAFGPALKQAVNPHLKSKYANLGACLDAVDDALLANGIVVYQETFESPTGVTVETVFLHESGESLRCGKLYVPAAKQDPQGYGSALTYARRYSLQTACGIAPEDDDGHAASNQPAQRQTQPKADTKQSPLNPADRAKGIENGVANGDTAAAAAAMAGWDEKTLNDVWQHLTEPTQNELTAAWPK
jgi:hypothetical protein